MKGRNCSQILKLTIKRIIIYTVNKFLIAPNILHFDGENVNLTVFSKIEIV